MSCPILTAYTLRYLSICQRRVWLDQHGDAGFRQDVSPAVFTGGLDHEARIGAAMFGPLQSVPVRSWDEMVQVTTSLMEQGVPGIQGAAFERTIDLPDRIIVRGRVDWLRRVAQPSRLGDWSYEPVEIKLRGRLLPEDRLQLDLYLWFLSDYQGVESSGWFWLGRDADNQPLNVLEHTYNPDRLFDAFYRVASVLTSEAAPPIFLGLHCKACHWRAHCEQTALANHDIALLPGLTRPTWEHLRREGIHTLDDVLAATPDRLKRFKGIGKSRAHDLTAHAQAVVTGMPVLRGPLPALVLLPGVMLDLETSLVDGGVWCFGWSGADGVVNAAIVDSYFSGDHLLLPDGTQITVVADSDEGWRLVARAALELPGPVYHWGAFEKAVLRATAPVDVINALDDRLHDLNRTFRRSCALPVRGTSIKKVAPYFGFHWPPGANAFSAWDDYRAWLLDGDADALARACAYNRADVDALALIWRWMTANAPSA